MELRDQHSPVKIIAMSGQFKPPSEFDTPDSPIDFFLFKPVTATILLHTLRRVLAAGAQA